ALRLPARQTARLAAEGGGGNARLHDGGHAEREAGGAPLAGRARVVVLVSAAGVRAAARGGAPVAVGGARGSGGDAEGLPPRRGPGVRAAFGLRLRGRTLPLRADALLRPLHAHGRHKRLGGADALRPAPRARLRPDAR